MNKFLLSSVIFSAIAFGYAFNCTPNATFKDDCNTCVCNDVGTNAICTEMGCGEESQLLSTTTEEPPLTTTVNGNQVCTPNEIKMHPETKELCNRCKCAANGIGWFCTRIPCPSSAQPAAVRECTPGEEFYQSCNRCTCTPSGLAMCTRMACPNERVHAKRQTNEDEAEITCTPGDRWKKDCNDCFCTETGVAACTLRGCLGRSHAGHHGHQRPHSVRVAPSAIPVIARNELESVDFRCTPHEYFKVECNNCKCSNDGRTAKCNKKVCVNGQR